MACYAGQLPFGQTRIHVAIAASPLTSLLSLYCYCKGVAGGLELKHTVAMTIIYGMAQVQIVACSFLFTAPPTITYVSSQLLFESPDYYLFIVCLYVCIHVCTGCLEKAASRLKVFQVKIRFQYIPIPKLSDNYIAVGSVSDQQPHDILHLQECSNGGSSNVGSGFTGFELEHSHVIHVNEAAT